MLPAIVFGDTHVHERDGKSRSAEFNAFSEKVRAIQQRTKATTLIGVGDLYDRNTSPSVGQILEIAALFRSFKEVILIVGNHDTPVRGSGYSLCDIFKLMGVRVVSSATVIEDCLFLPYFSTEYEDRQYRYVFMHKDIVELNAYCDKEFGLQYSTLPRAQVLFNGHLHRHQIVDTVRGRLIQVGAPYPTDWGNAYEHNRFVYLLSNGKIERAVLNITADEGAEDATQYSFVRKRDAKAAVEREHAVAGIEAARAESMSLEECLSLVTAEPRVKTIIRGVVRNVGAARVSSERL